MTAASPLRSDIVVDPEFHALVPALQADERGLLEESLRCEGCREPLVVWQETGILLDGHNRLDICTKLDIAFSTTSMSFPTRSNALLWIIENQLGRRNLSDIDRVNLARHLEDLLKAEATKNRGQRTDLVQNSAPGSKRRRTRERAAAAAGVSHDTFNKAKTVLDDGVPELVQAVRAREASLHAAVEVAALPADEQREVINNGTIKPTADKLRNRRTKNTGNNEWGTPREYIDAGRQVLGSIDLDPATNDYAQMRIRATKFHTAENDGLSKQWKGTVFLNPPYSSTLIKRFVQKLIDEYVAGNVTAAVLLTNNETEASWFQAAAKHASQICFPSKRIWFLRPDGRRSKPGPLQGQAVFYFGADTAQFAQVFGEFGVVVQAGLQKEGEVVG